MIFAAIMILMHFLYPRNNIFLYIFFCHIFFLGQFFFIFVSFYLFLFIFLFLSLFLYLFIHLFIYLNNYQSLFSIKLIKPCQMLFTFTWNDSIFLPF